MKEVICDKLQIKEQIEIERAHRVGSRDNTRPRTIVCKMLNYSDKEKVQVNVKQLKGTNIYINDDFSEETTKLRKALLLQQIHWENGKYAKVVYHKLILKDFPEQ